MPPVSVTSQARKVLPAVVPLVPLVPLPAAAVVVVVPLPLDPQAASVVAAARANPRLTTVLRVVRATSIVLCDPPLDRVRGHLGVKRSCLPLPVRNVAASAPARCSQLLRWGARTEAAASALGPAKSRHQAFQIRKRFLRDPRRFCGHSGCQDVSRFIAVVSRWPTRGDATCGRVATGLDASGLRSDKIVYSTLHICNAEYTI